MRGDLDQRGRRWAKDVGDAKAVADLDELAAGDQHLSAARRGRHGEQDRGGVVVDHEGILGARERAEHVVHVVLARGALAARQAELEVAVAAAGHDHGLQRLARQH